VCLLLDDVLLDVIPDNVFEIGIHWTTKRTGLLTRHGWAHVNLGDSGLPLIGWNGFDAAERDASLLCNLLRRSPDVVQRPRCVWHLHNPVMSDGSPIHTRDHVIQCLHVRVEGRAWVWSVHWQGDAVHLFGVVQCLREDASVWVRDGVGKARSSNHSRETADAPVQETLSSVIGDKQLVARLLATVRDRRKSERFFSDCIGFVEVVVGSDVVGGAVEVDLWSAQDFAEGSHPFHDVKGTKQVNFHAEVKVDLGISGKQRSQMNDGDSGATFWCNHLLDGGLVAQVTLDPFDTSVGKDGFINGTWIAEVKKCDLFELELLGWLRLH
jgi:hypothetical protein